MTTSIRGRRARAFALAVVAAGALAAGCTRPHPHPPTTTARPGGPALVGSWELIPGSLGVPIPPNVPVTAEFGPARVAGSSGCNAYFADVTAGPGMSLAIRNIGGTDRACDEATGAVERAFLTKLGATTRYRISGGELTLSGAEGDLRFRRAGGGAPSAGPVGRWTVTGYVDDRTQAFVSLIPGTSISLVINADGTLGGTACNSYGADWSVSGDRITISSIIATEMYCIEPEGVTEQESRYFGALGAATRWQVEGGTLILASGGDRGRPLVTAERAAS